MTQQGLSRRLTGQTKFTVDDLRTIAVALDTTISTLLVGVA